MPRVRVAAEESTESTESNSGSTRKTKCRNRW